MAVIAYTLWRIINLMNFLWRKISEGIGWNEPIHPSPLFKLKKQAKPFDAVLSF